MIVNLEGVQEGLSRIILTQNTPVMAYFDKNNSGKIGIAGVTNKVLWITFNSTAYADKAFDLINSALTYDPNNPAHSAHFI